MTKNYRIIERTSRVLREDELEHLLEDGWELVSAMHDDGNIAYFYYFKKIKK